MSLANLRRSVVTLWLCLCCISIKRYPASICGSHLYNPLAKCRSHPAYRPYRWWTFTSGKGIKSLMSKVKVRLSIPFDFRNQCHLIRSWIGPIHRFIQFISQAKQFLYRSESAFHSTVESGMHTAIYILCPAIPERFPIEIRICLRWRYRRNPATFICSSSLEKWRHPVNAFRRDTGNHAKEYAKNFRVLYSERLAILWQIAYLVIRG